MALACLLFTWQSWASPEYCSRESFTPEELKNTYESGTKKTLEKYWGQEAEKIFKSIEKKATSQSNSAGHPCLANTTSCFGQDKSWTYEKEIIRDAFGNPLQFNGFITSKQYDRWPAPDLYFDLHTETKYTCSWGENLKAYCEKWCSLTVIDDRFHD